MIKVLHEVDDNLWSFAHTGSLENGDFEETIFTMVEAQKYLSEHDNAIIVVTELV